MPRTVKRKVTMPEVLFRRIRNEHVGRGPNSPRLKDTYLAPVPGYGWLATNFSGAFHLFKDPKLENCPFPEPVVEEIVSGEDDLVPAPPLLLSPEKILEVAESLGWDVGDPALEEEFPPELAPHDEGFLDEVL